MKLSNRKNVIISKEKLTKYLLSETHPIGRFKAKFFRGLGFDETNVDLLERSIRKLVQINDVKEESSSPYGNKYLIEGKMSTPSGKTITVRTVWVIEEGQTKARFITIYPV